MARITRTALCCPAEKPNSLDIDVCIFVDILNDFSWMSLILIHAHLFAE